jgi:hypothetical protein
MQIKMKKSIACKKRAKLKPCICSWSLHNQKKAGTHFSIKMDAHHWNLFPIVLDISNGYFTLSQKLKDIWVDSDD